uniref:Uncharacterized protein n=1 Tax=viral metagenome TaxID=1070528 RepID=A0A6M3KXD9_9ZZZZ
MSTPLLDWFDDRDPEHCQAWLFLERKGHWPENFIPDDIEFGTGNWSVTLAYRMAHHWARVVSLHGKAP